VKKVVAINGSHRKGKNTAIMLQTVLNEISIKGIETELIELADYNIKVCKSCNRCLSQTKCSITDDDMEVLTKKIVHADGIILGSPVYWNNVTGLMKNFMDRTRFLHMSKNLLNGKIGAAVTHGGLRNGGQEMCLLILEKFLNAHGLIVADARDPQFGIQFSGAMGTLQKSFDNSGVVWHKNVNEDIAALQACKQLGKNMLKLLNGL
jgi:multimeric flavodoxin WrbA